MREWVEVNVFFCNCIVLRCYIISRCPILLHFILSLIVHAVLGLLVSYACLPAVRCILLYYQAGTPLLCIPPYGSKYWEWRAQDPHWIINRFYSWQLYKYAIILLKCCPLEFASFFLLLVFFPLDSQFHTVGVNLSCFCFDWIHHFVSYSSPILVLMIFYLYIDL